MSCGQKKRDITESHLDVSSFMLEVDPGVRVAPDEDGEEQSGQGRGQQHDDQAEEAAVAEGHQRRVVGSGILKNIVGIKKKRFLEI